MGEHNTYSKVFEPVRIGGMELRNRLVMLPMETNYGDEGGAVTDRAIDYFAARSKDVGLVLVQITSVESGQGKAYRQQLCIDDDRLIPGLTRLSDAIHGGGAKGVIQLHHAGVLGIGGEPVAASAISMRGRPAPRELSATEIGGLIGKYAQAAGRAREAGFDGVEIVASGGYLVWSFLSPTTNLRTDEYGGDLEGRSRLLLEIIEAVRAEVGSDVPITCRLAAREYGGSPGFSVADAIQVLRWAKDTGLDGVTTTAIGGDSVAPSQSGVLLPLSRAIKQGVSLPVTAAGRMDLDLAERALVQGKADLVGFGRRLLADPDYISKTTGGMGDDVRPCIACKECIHSSLVKNQPLRCTVNPFCGREATHGIERARTSRRVMVIGGGPAGMQAAIIAAERGHEVSLHERSPDLGGQLDLAEIPPNKEHIAAFTKYLKHRVASSEVAADLGREVTIVEIEAAAPDAVILATGIEPIVPPIPGMDLMHTVMAEDVLTGATEVGCETVVVGGELMGCETAEFLADRGAIVTVVEVNEGFVTKSNPLVAMRLLARLRHKGVTLLGGVTEEVFKNNQLELTTAEGERKTIPVDTVVIAAGGRPSTGLADAVKTVVGEVFTIGDCVEPRSIMEATTDGLNAGRSV